MAKLTRPVSEEESVAESLPMKKLKKKPPETIRTLKRSARLLPWLELRSVELK